MTRTERSFSEHVREQFNEHKQLIIRPIILPVLFMPRLIISLLHGCVKTSENLWLYLTMEGCVLFSELIAADLLK